DERVADHLERDRVDHSRSGAGVAGASAPAGSVEPTPVVIFPSARSSACCCGSRRAGSPQPPPPAVRCTYTSPGWIVVENIDGSTSSVPSAWISKFDESAPGPPPWSPYGGCAARSDRTIKDVSAVRHRQTRSTASPPRCSPSPPESGTSP